MIDVFAYPSIEARDADTKEGGIFLGTASDLNELDAVIAKAPENAKCLNYFKTGSDEAMSMDDAMETLGAVWDEILETYTFNGMPC